MGPGRAVRRRAPWTRAQRPAGASARADGPLVEVRQAGVRIDGEDLLRPVSLDLEAGRALAVRGPNGAGKTTLLRVVAGLTRPTTGTVLVGGTAPDERDPGFRGRLAALVGPPPLARDLTLLEHLALVGASWGGAPPEAADRGHELLTDLGIERLVRRFPHELSSGQAQLFSLALTLVRPFEVLLVDEPEQRLDAQRLETVATVLRRAVDDGGALLVASHSDVLVEHVTDAVVVLDDAARDRALP